MTTINSSNEPRVSTNGQLIIGSTGAFAVASTLTQGSGITITNGAGSITIASSSGSGAWTLIASATASNSASVNFDNNLSATYDNYVVVMENVVPGTTSTTLRLQVGTGAAVYSATTYIGCCAGSNTSNGAQTPASGTTAADLTPNNVSMVNTSTTTTGGWIVLTNINNASNNKSISGNLVWTSTSPFTGHAYPGILWQTATVLTSVKFLMSSGNISTGVFKLYGITN